MLRLRALHADYALCCTLEWLATIFKMALNSSCHGAVNSAQKHSVADLACGYRRSTAQGGSVAHFDVDDLPELVQLFNYRATRPPDQVRVCKVRSLGDSVPCNSIVEPNLFSPAKTWQLLVLGDRNARLKCTGKCCTRGADCSADIVQGADIATLAKLVINTVGGLQDEAYPIRLTSLPSNVRSLPCFLVDSVHSIMAATSPRHFCYLCMRRKV